MPRTYTDQQAKSLETRAFGLHAAAFHYTKKAKEGIDRASQHVLEQNPMAMAQELALLRENINQVYALLGDPDAKDLEGKK